MSTWNMGSVVQSKASQAIVPMIELSVLAPMCSPE